MVVDSSALVAIVLGEPERECFLSIIAGDDACLIGAPTLLETAMVVTDRKGDYGITVLRRTVQKLRIAVAPFGSHDCHVALGAFLRYGKGRHRARLNFGDCMAYAVAKTRRRKLLYKGDDFSHTDIEPAA